MANGTPYDTIHGPIGLRGDYHGSLKFYGIGYRQVDLLEDGTPDVEGVAKAAASPDVGAVLIQRSCGYSVRPSLSVVQIKELCRAIRGVSDAVIVIDNCYGEFAESEEPGGVDGGDLLCGSLIKNPGGGIAESGGYVVGREDLVEKAAFLLTVPGIGGECGSTFGQNRLLYQGLFLAPHIVANSLKTAVFCAKIMEIAGYKCSPGWDEERHDIIQRIEFGDPQQVRVFCEGIQEASPVDLLCRYRHLCRGYDCDIIMAAGTLSSTSIEPSCDDRAHLTWRLLKIHHESSKLGVMNALGRVLSLK